MTDSGTYLRLEIAGANYLLPSTAGFTIEQRENLTLNDSAAGNIAAWRPAKNGRWPAYGLGGDLRVDRRGAWQRAVFLDAAPHAVGIALNEVQLLPRLETSVARFTPMGPPPTRAGHLFSGAWLTDKGVVLVLEPKALIAYLQGLGE